MRCLLVPPVTAQLPAEEAGGREAGRLGQLPEVRVLAGSG